MRSTPRARLWRIVIPLVVFVGATFAFMPRPLLGQRVYLAVDLLENTAPYRTAIERRPHIESFVQTDQAEAVAPNAIAFSRALKHGNWQKWDPHVASGTPAGFPPLNGIMSPFNWGYLFLPAWYAVGFRIAFALLFAQAFSYLLFRRLGAGMYPALIGAVAYAFTGANLAAIHRIMPVFVLPALLWAAHRLVSRPSVGNSVVLGAFFAWAWFDGFPSAFAYCVYVISAWVVCLAFVKWRASRSRRALVAPLVALAGAGAWGAAVASVSLLPFARELTARHVLESRTVAHLRPVNVFGLLTSAVPGPATKGPIWTGINPVEGVSYLGLIPVAIAGLGLVLVALRRLRLTDAQQTAWTFFSLLGSLVILLCYVGAPLLDVLGRLPGIANNPIYRSRFLIGMAVAVLMVLALDAFWKRGVHRAELRAPAVWASRATIVFLVVVFARYAPDLIRLAHREYTHQVTKDAANKLRSPIGLMESDLLRNGLLALAAVAVVVAVMFYRRLIPLAALAVAALVFVQLTGPMYDFTPAAPKSDFYTVQRGDRALQSLLGDRYRFAASGSHFYPNSSAQILGMYDLRGLAFHPPQYRKLLEAMSPIAFARDSFKVILTRDEYNLASPVLDDLSVRYIALDTSDFPYGSLLQADASYDSWRPVASANALPETASPGAIDGVVVPLRESGSCGHGLVRLTVRSPSIGARSSERPLHDVRDTPDHWVSFAVRAHGVRSGDPFRIEVRSTDPGCKLEVGTVGGDTPRVATRLLTLGPELPVRLASTEQAWIYERPSAPPLVSTYSRWRAFRTQQAALAYLQTRPPSESDVVPYVGSGPKPRAGARPSRVLSSKTTDNNIRVRVSGPDTSLLSTGQLLDKGWQVSIDDKPARRVLVDGAVMATFVPPGTHNVRWSYQPASFTAGALISAITLAATAVWGLVVALLAFRRRRRSRGREQAVSADAADALRHDDDYATLVDPAPD